MENKGKSEGMCWMAIPMMNRRFSKDRPFHKDPQIVSCYTNWDVARPRKKKTLRIFDFHGAIVSHAIRTCNITVGIVHLSCFTPLKQQSSLTRDYENAVRETKRD
ncbi:hypothetical protein M0804_014475 [Polistes exclamans]|nr:hypothetical protein M0804_014476 [Polistes exclamans]KAI4475166.1 hypothetical protein M0804_014475 [Polistes exclamans]